MDMNEPCSKEEERQCIGEEEMIDWFLMSQKKRELLYDKMNFGSN
jgi:hypothetical protein